MKRFLGRNHRIAIACALALGVALPISASSTEFRSYFRAGIGGADGGGTQQCFRLPGAGAKYRLGNECEQWLEFYLRDDLANLADGSILTAEGMTVLYNPYGEKATFNSDSEGGVRLAQAYLSWRNLPWLGGGALWAGRRFYYKQADIHINDFFYRNMAGLGFGIEDIGIGPLKLTYFFSRKDNVFQQDYISRHDLLLEGIKTNPGGMLEFGFNYIPGTSHANTHAGWALIARHQQQLSNDTKNVFALQYGRGPGTGLGNTGNLFLDRDNSRWRVIDALEWQRGRFGGQAGFVWQKDRFNNGTSQQWRSLGVRPVYGIGGRFKLAFEVGYDQVKSSLGQKAHLTKLTFAPSWAPRGTGFWQRPEIRLYYTWAQWNRAAQQAADSSMVGAALSSTGAFGPALHGSHFGVQIEYW